MEVPSHLVQRAVTHAQEILHHYAELPEAMKANRPDALLYICREYIHKTVHIFMVTMKAPFVRGYYEALETGYHVRILAPQEPIWINFVACKELFHGVLDDPDCEDCGRTVNLYGHIEEIMATFPQPDGKPGVAAVSEFLAELAAMEFLLPFADRMQYYKPGAPID